MLTRKDGDLNVKRQAEAYHKNRLSQVNTASLRQEFLDRMSAPESERHLEYLLNGCYGAEPQYLFYFYWYKGGKSRLNWKALAFQEVAYNEAVCEKTGARLSPEGANKVWKELPEEAKERLESHWDWLLENYPVPSCAPRAYIEEFSLPEELLEV